VGTGCAFLGWQARDTVTNVAISAALGNAGEAGMGKVPFRRIAVSADAKSGFYRCIVTLADGSPDRAFPLGNLHEHPYSAIADADDLKRRTGLPVDTGGVVQHLRRGVRAWNRQWVRRREAGAGGGR
jgi:hypothetical protein